MGSDFWVVLYQLRIFHGSKYTLSPMVSRYCQKQNLNLVMKEICHLFNHSF